MILMRLDDRAAQLERRPVPLVEHAVDAEPHHEVGSNGSMWMSLARSLMAWRQQRVDEPDDRGLVGVVEELGVLQAEKPSSDLHLILVDGAEDVARRARRRGRRTSLVSVSSRSAGSEHRAAPAGRARGGDRRGTTERMRARRCPTTSSPPATYIGKKPLSRARPSGTRRTSSRVERVGRERR
jgi:hypothetical protein